MTEKMTARNIAEAELLLRQNSSREALEKLASTVDAETLRFLAGAAAGLSWEDKNSAFANFALDHNQNNNN